MTAPRELRVRVGTLRVVGGSRLEARRIAEALPAALERALADLTEAGRAGMDRTGVGRTGPGRPAARPARTAPGPADVVARAVADRVLRAADAAGAEVAP